MVLYVCEICSLILREKYRLRVVKNKVLRRIFGPRINEMSGVRKWVHNEQFHDFYSYPFIIGIIRSARM
jgi:hypothetical protein